MKICNSSSKNQPYLVLLGGFLIHLSIGNFYSSGNIQQNIISYMQNHSLSGNSVEASTSIWIFGLLAFGLGSAISAGGYLERKIGSPLTTLIGGGVMSLNVIFTYFTIKTYLSVMALSYGLIAGMGSGLAYGVAVGAPLKWFPNHRGLVIGIVVSGFGLSSSIFDIIQNCVIGFDGGKYEKNLSYLPLSFVVLGCSYIVLQVIGSILMKENCQTTQSEENLQSDLEDQCYSNLFNTRTRSIYFEAELEPHQLIFEFDFWILWLTILFSLSTIPIFTSLHNDFGNSLNISTKQVVFDELTNINIIGGLCNASGRIFWGYLTMRKPYKFLMIILSLSNAIFLGSFYFLIHINPETVRKFIFGLWVAAINFFQGGHLSVLPTICAKLFGINNFACNYGLLFTAYSISALIISTIATLFYKSYGDLCLELFMIGSSMAVIGAGLTLLFRGRSLIVSRY